MMDKLMDKIRNDEKFFEKIVERGEKTPTCKDCKFYKPIDENKGDCFGHEVMAKCLQKSVQQTPSNREGRDVKMHIKIRILHFY